MDMDSPMARGAVQHILDTNGLLCTAVPAVLLAEHICAEYMWHSVRATIIVCPPGVAYDNGGPTEVLGHEHTRDP